MDKPLSIEVKASYAKQLKKNKLFDVIFIDIENDLLKQIKNSGYTEHGLREELYVKLQALELLSAKIDCYINEALIENQEDDQSSKNKGE